MIIRTVQLSWFHDYCPTLHVTTHKHTKESTADDPCNLHLPFSQSILQLSEEATIEDTKGANIGQNGIECLLRQNWSVMCSIS